MLMKSSAALLAAFALSAAVIPGVAGASSAPFVVADIPPPQPPEPGPTPDQPDQQASPEAQITKSFVLRDGVVELPGGKAKVTIAQGFAYLDSADTRKLLVDVWHNPPDAVGEVMGAIIPAEADMLEASGWAAIITYEEEGHVADDDAASINYDDLMKEMQTGFQEANSERIKAGYEPITIVGWAQSPSYDAAEHKLYWAKHLRFGTDGETLNYSIRALGRTGVLQVNVVADMRQLSEINAKVSDLLKMVSFNEGHRYADFDESTDAVAAYGLAALVAGGVAAKAGLLKGLLIFLAAFWKIIAVGVIAVGGGIWRLISGRAKPDAPTPS